MGRTARSVLRRRKWEPVDRADYRGRFLRQRRGSSVVARGRPKAAPPESNRARLVRESTAALRDPAVPGDRRWRNACANLRRPRPPPEGGGVQNKVCRPRRARGEHASTPKPSKRGGLAMRAGPSLRRRGVLRGIRRGRATMGWIAGPGPPTRGRVARVVACPRVRPWVGGLAHVQVGSEAADEGAWI